MLTVPRRDLTEVLAWATPLGLLATCALLVAHVAAQGQTEPLLEAYDRFVAWAVAGVAWCSARHVLAVESDRRGWDFLEGLPLGRRRVVLGKLVVGAVPPALVLLGGALLTEATWRLFVPDPDGLRGRLLVGGAAHAALCYGVGALVAATGRARPLALGALVLGLAALHRAAPALLARAAPLLEGGALRAAEAPWPPIAVGAAGLVLAFGLATTAGGRLARAAQGPPGGRTLAGGLVLATVAAWLARGPGAPPAALDLGGPGARAGDVVARGLDGEGPAGRALLERLAGALAELQGQAGTPPWPVLLEPATGLPAGAARRLPRPGRQGVHLAVAAASLDGGPLVDGGATADARERLCARVLDEVLEDVVGSPPGLRGLLRDGLPDLLASGPASRAGEGLLARRERLAAWAAARTRALWREGGPGLTASWSAARRAAGGEGARALAGWVLTRLGAHGAGATDGGGGGLAALLRTVGSGADPARALGGLGLGGGRLDAWLAERLAALLAAEGPPAREDAALADALEQGSVGYERLGDGDGWALRARPPALAAGGPEGPAPGDDPPWLVLLHAEAAPGQDGPPRAPTWEVARAGGPEVVTARAYAPGSRVWWTWGTLEPGREIERVGGWRVLELSR